MVPIQKLAAGLTAIPEKDFTHAAVLEYLRAHRVDVRTLTPYLYFSSERYTRNLIHKTSQFELIAICWEIGQKSAIHNHRDQNCWMAVPAGRLLVENFHLIKQDIDGGECKLAAADTVEMKPGQPCAVNPGDPVHRVYNPREFNQRAISLHVYSRPFDTCVVYSPEQGTCGVIQLHYTTEYGRKS
jgi:cysteine dioxygenase